MDPADPTLDDLEERFRESVNLAAEIMVEMVRKGRASDTIRRRVEHACAVTESEVIRQVEEIVGPMTDSQMLKVQGLIDKIKGNGAHIGPVPLVESHRFRRDGVMIPRNAPPEERR